MAAPPKSRCNAFLTLPKTTPDYNELTTITQDNNDGNGYLPDQAGEVNGFTINPDPENSLEGISDRAWKAQEMARVEMDKAYANSPSNHGVSSNHTHKKKRRNRRGALKFIFLNIKGEGSTSTHQKWNELCQLVREKGIDILVIQEAHLSKTHTHELNYLFE